jgi:hypothetical protein
MGQQRIEHDIGASAMVGSRGLEQCDRLGERASITGANALDQSNVFLLKPHQWRA